MAGKTKRIQELTSLAEQAGLKVLEAGISNGVHIYLLVETPKGPRKIFAPFSGSDRRADMNQLSFMRRMAKGLV